MPENAVKDSSIDIPSDGQQGQQQYVSNHTDSITQETKLPYSSFDPPNFNDLKRNHGWKHAIEIQLINYFPHYKYQEQGIVQIEERPSWIYCLAYGLQHLLSMLSGVIMLPLILGYDSNTSLFFSGVATMIFFIVTGGRVPSYLGCSGSIFSVVLSVTGYKYTENNMGLNSNIAPAQGAILVLSLSYIAVALLVMILGYRWLEFLMPPVVTGAIITSIGLHLSFMAYNSAATSNFNTYMAVVTAGSIMMLSVYAPISTMRKIAVLLGTLLGYFVHAMCGIAGVGPPIDFSEIVSSPWVQLPHVYFGLQFDANAISMTMPILVVLLAENLGHMKAIGSITNRPIMKYVGRAYLGDALGCLIASLAGTIPYTTYSENIGILSVTQVFSPLVILCGSFFAMLLGFFAKFSAVAKSIPQGVLGGVTLILYTVIAITGIRIWIVNKVDFNDSRNIFIGGIPVILATVVQNPLQIGNFQLDGIGVATFGSIILYQLLYCSSTLFNYVRFIWHKFASRRQRSSVQ